MSRRDALGSMACVAAGDIVINRRLAAYNEPDYLALLDRLRDSDCRFANLETTIRAETGYPAAETGGTCCAADPYVFGELKWAGFNLLARANNHALDFGIGGLDEAGRLLDELGIVHAGAGRDLAHARMPAYLDTGAGRVALVAATATFPTSSRAGRAREDCTGRPGVAYVRQTSVHLLDAASFASLRAISELLGFEEYKLRCADEFHLKSTETAADRLEFLQTEFMVGDPPGTRSGIHSTDAKEVWRSIAGARRQADLVVFSFHAHQQGSNRETPAEAFPPFLRACVDAGASMVVCHGPHVLRGIEVYRGAPIFHGLGNFVFQNETFEVLPDEMYERHRIVGGMPADVYDRRTNGGASGAPSNPSFWESALVRCAWEHHRLIQIEIHPVTLGFRHGRTVRGRPLLARGETAERILDAMSRLSRPWGTTIQVADGIGRVALP